MSRIKIFIVFLCVFLFNGGLQAKNLKNKSNKPHQNVKKFSIIFHEKYDISFLGMENLHPFDSKKYGKVFKNLQRSLSLKKEQFYKPSELNPKDLELVHSKEYLNSLNHSKTIANIAEIPPLKFLPNFALKSFVLTPMKYATSGTVLGAQLALQYGWAINLSGGYHHAKANSGEGFCVFADIPLVVHKLLQKILT
jgi:histone deacetylase 11